MEELLVVKAGERVSPLDRLRRAPTRISSPAMVEALNRLTELRSLGVGHLKMARVSPGRVKALARYAAAAWAASIARMPTERRIATLVAFAHTFEAVAQDDALDLLNQLITQCLARAEQSGKQERLRTLHDLDAAAIRLNAVCKVVLDPQYEDAQLRSVIFERVAKGATPNRFGHRRCFDAARRRPLLRLLTGQLQHDPAFPALAAAHHPVRRGQSRAARAPGP